MLRFFLSYAAHDDDSYTLRFFRDLSGRVRELARTDGDVGFVDARNVDNEPVWSAPAWDALTSCRTFVALCSPRYFLSARCGREWSIFAARLRRYEQANGRSAPALLPVLWSGEDVPRQFDEVGHEPLRQLIRLRSLRPRYEAYVTGLARQIVACSDAHDIPPADPDLDPTTAPNAFDPAGSARGVDSAPGVDPVPPSLASSPAQQVHFVVAAGTLAEMGAVRNDLRYYGERGQDWAPYRPAQPAPLVTHARAIAADRLFGSDVADLDGLADRLDQAHRNNDIVVLLVDSWATKLSAYQRILADFDGRADSAVAVLAPENGADAETVRHRGELRARLTGTLAQSIARSDQLVRIEIDSAESFECDLRLALEEAQNRIFSHGRVFRRPTGDEPADRPILQGP